MKNMQNRDKIQDLSAIDSSVQHDKLQCLSQCTPVFNATDSSVCQPPQQPLRRCGNCQSLYPASAFYMKDKQGTMDSYCKECRKTANRLRRKGRIRSGSVEDLPPSYPVITRIGQREVRLHLIMDALETVRQIADRKKREQHEREFLASL